MKSGGQTRGFDLETGSANEASDLETGSANEASDLETGSANGESQRSTLLVRTPGFLPLYVIAASPWRSVSA
jgi:hypothetical protein